TGGFDRDAGQDGAGWIPDDSGDGALGERAGGKEDREPNRRRENRGPNPWCHSRLLLSRACPDTDSWLEATAAGDKNPQKIAFGDMLRRLNLERQPEGLAGPVQLESLPELSGDRSLPGQHGRVQPETRSARGIVVPPGGRIRCRERIERDEAAAAGEI